MDDMRRGKASRTLQWLVAAATVLVAALLIWQCADIYHVGTSAENLTETGVRINDIYSPEIVSERFEKIAWAVWLCLGLLAAALIAGGGRRGHEALQIPAENRLAVMLARTEMTQAMRKEEKKRRNCLILCMIVCAVCAAAVLRYLLLPTSFASRDLEPVMGQLVLHITPWVVAAVAALMVHAQLREASVLREIDLAKQAEKKPMTAAAAKHYPVNAARAVLMAAAIVLIVLGIMNGGMRDVLVKAINICTECIGLG